MRTVEEYRAKLIFPEYRRHLTIADRATSRRITYQPNKVQQRLDAEIVRQALLDKPIRIRGLKSRRMGFSTHIQMRFTHSASTSRTFHGATVAHDDAGSAYLHGMTEKAIEQLPESLRLPKKTGITGKRIEFVHGSTLRTFTAGSREGVGRAQAANALHLSEVAYWPDPKATMTALLQLVPDEPGTLIVEESTANGIGDEWYRSCEASMNGDDDYVWFFAPWFEFDDYTLDDARTGEMLGKAPEWSSRELSLIARGVTPPQLAWRRWAVQNLCGGDAAIFDQEYPDSPEVAFLTSGRPYFPFELLERFHPIDASRIGSIEGDPIRGGSSLRFEANQQGPLRIWQVPKPGREYIVFGDVAGKVTLDTHDARPIGKKDDYCAASVVDRETGEQVAAYHARIDPDLYGLELARLGYLYKTALVAVENTGGYGVATIATLYRSLTYPNLYTHRKLDSYTQAWTDEIGWDTTETTRPVMLSSLRSMLRDHPERLKDDGLKREMRTFVVHSNGKPAAQSGTHDDRVMSHAGALEVWREHAQRPLRVKAQRKTALREYARNTGSISERAPRISA
jgi:hypothetical protein